jgi:hypothetical protein
MHYAYSIAIGGVIRQDNPRFAANAGAATNDPPAVVLSIGVWSRFEPL